MKFLYIRLTNFLSYKDLELDLTNIAYASVTGPNGSGKSTIPSAIPWILYGSVRVTSDGDSIVNDESESASGYLDLQDNEGNLWQIARGRDYNGGGWVRIFQWDKESDDWIPFGDHLNKTAQTQIDKIVGISEDAFYSLMLMSSSGGTRFTAADSNTRRSILHGLIPELGLWSRYHYATQEKLSDAKRELGRIDQDVETKNRFITENEEKKAEILNQIDDETQEKIDGDLASIDKKLTRLTKKISANSESNIEEIETRIDAAKSKHQLNLSNLRSAVSKLEDEFDDLEDAESKIVKLKKSKADSESEFDVIKAESKTLKKAIKTDKIDVTDLEAAVERLEPKREASEASISKSKNRLADIRDQLDGLELAIEKDSGACPVCSSPLSTKKCHSLLDDLEAEKADLARKLEDDTASNRTLKNKLVDTQTLLASANNRIQRSESRVESLSERLDSLDSALDKIEESIDDAKSALKKLRPAEEIEEDVKSKNSEISDAKRVYDEDVIAILEKELATAESDDSNTQLQEEMDDLKDDQKLVSQRNQLFSRLSGSLSTTEEAISSLESQRIADVKRQVELGDDIGELAWLDRALSQKGIPSMLLDSVLGAIEHEQNLILEQLSDSDQMRVEFRQTKALKSRDGQKDVLDIIVHTAGGGREKTIEAFSSGQKVRLSISNIFAMIKVFNERSGGIVKTLFLDEPLGVLDDKSVPAFIEVLRVAMNTGIVDSIWVITHDRTVIDALPQEIKVYMDESRESRVSVV